MRAFARTLVRNSLLLDTSVPEFSLVSRRGNILSPKSARGHCLKLCAATPTPSHVLSRLARGLRLIPGPAPIGDSESP